MNRIDDSNRPNACVCSGPSNTPSATASGNSTFRKILDTVSVVASAAIPGLPIIGAISNVFKKHTDLDPGRFTGSSEALQYLELQRAIEIETRAFETASNVLKARHDAHMNSIRNLRS